MLFFALCRNGGGIGEGSIRKTAYFQSSIDPTIFGPKVRRELYHTSVHIVLHTCYMFMFNCVG